jgi:Protein of unknown function (DUF1592)/Protein of unknown function (DUF1588)/Protein of unknown function (DUF1585)/Protein of unknown function (DUF1587)/Protein of unknown function (DUF1595)/Planctomycete cytochrome C
MVDSFQNTWQRPRIAMIYFPGLPPRSRSRLAAALVLLAALPFSLVAAEPADPDFTGKVAPVLKQFCIACHGGKKPKGDLALDALAPDLGKNGLVWKSVLERLTDGTMPPEGKPRPGDAQTRTVRLWIVDGLKAQQAKRVAAQGRALIRRLNRVEYSSTIRDLLGVDLDLTETLPEDGVAHGFDVVDVALDLSSTLMERYLEAADLALDAALVHGPKPRTISKRIAMAQIAREARGGKPRFGLATLIQTDGVVFLNESYPPKVIREVRAPVAGRYRYRISASTFRDTDQKISFLIYSGSHSPRGGRTWLSGVFDAGPKPGIIEFTERLEKNDTIRIVPYGVTRQFRLAEGYQGPGLAVQWAEVEGPLLDSWPPAGYTRLMGSVDPEKGTLADAEDILRRFAARAYRRPVTNGELRPLFNLVKDRLAKEYTFEEALRVGLKGVLCSPGFLYLRTSPGRLNDHELASRLSYFLWSTMPDDRLLDLASKGTLGKPDVLRAEVERMLHDPRARAFTENFTGQWLGLRNIKATEPDRKLYPEFDALLEYSMVQETRRFFDEILTGDLSLLNFVHSDFSILNQRLAKHYGIEGVKGQALRKVHLPADSHRGGVLTQASVLKVTANGTTTSPVLRGVWVLERIVGKPAPPPPKNVPAIEPDTRGAISIRDQLARHRSVPSCAACHQRIDPAGYALESFDVIGGWRERYRVVGGPRNRANRSIDGRRVQYGLGPQVECADELPGGRKFSGIDEFKKLLLEDRDQVTRSLTEKLLVYATGHGPELADTDTVEKIVAAVRAKRYGFRTLIHAITQSDLFRKK